MVLTVPSPPQNLSEETDEFEDLLESREAELQEFEPAPRLTEADRAEDMRSLDRQLDRVLYLLVKKPREEHAWQMPQGGVEGEESLIEVRLLETVADQSEEVRHASQNADSACPFCIDFQCMLSQQFMMHISPPLVADSKPPIDHCHFVCAVLLPFCWIAQEVQEITIKIVQKD